MGTIKNVENRLPTWANFGVIEKPVNRRVTRLFQFGGAPCFFSIGIRRDGDKRLMYVIFYFRVRNVCISFDAQKRKSVKRRFLL